MTFLKFSLFSIVVLQILHLDASTARVVHSFPSIQKLKIARPNLGATYGGNNPNQVVETPLGKIIPVVKSSRDGRNFFAFFKVPYAKPPVGNLRFEPPQPTEGWNGTIAETEVAPQCIQKSKYSPIDESAGEEDCLYLNIYSPKLPENSKNVSELLPTMVYIHGGGFNSGNGSRYGPEYFMDENVVLITFQYRLGVFGFLNSGDGLVKGNMGMKDQIMALRWVKENIKYFGGDPRKVTIFGNSAGGVSVSFHLLSRISKGYFHRGIIQSGTATSGFLIDPNPAASKNAIARAVNCSSEIAECVISCLKNANASELAILEGGDIHHAITLEEPSTEAFLSEYPLSILQNGRANNTVPVIFGINSAEWLAQALMILKSPAETNMLNQYWSEMAPTLLNYEGSVGTISTDEISSKIKEFYFQDNDIGNDTMRGLINVLTDKTGFIHSSKIEAAYHAKTSDVYLYYLTKEPAKSYAQAIKEGFPPGYYGPSHADEIQFLFPYYGYPEIPIGSEYYAFSKMMVKAWSTFATDGKPVEAWKRIRPDDNCEEWYQLDDQQQMVNVLAPRMAFWDQFALENLKYT